MSHLYKAKGIYKGNNMNDTFSGAFGLILTFISIEFIDGWGKIAGIFVGLLLAFGQFVYIIIKNKREKKLLEIAKHEEKLAIQAYKMKEEEHKIRMKILRKDLNEN